MELRVAKLEKDLKKLKKQLRKMNSEEVYEVTQAIGFTLDHEYDEDAYEDEPLP